MASDCKPFPNLPSFDPCPPAKGQEEGHLPPELATPSPSSTWTHPRPARSSRLCKGYPQMAENSWLSSHRQLSLYVLNSHRGIHPLCVHAYVETCRMHVQKEGAFHNNLHMPFTLRPWYAHGQLLPRGHGERLPVPSDSLQPAINLHGSHSSTHARMNLRNAPGT